MSSLLQQFQVLRQGRLTCKHLLAVSLAQATSTEFLIINFNIFFSILIQFCSVPYPSIWILRKFVNSDVKYRSLPQNSLILTKVAIIFYTLRFCANLQGIDYSSIKASHTFETIFTHLCPYLISCTYFHRNVLFVSYFSDNFCLLFENPK